MSKLYIITGTSKGIGLELLKFLCGNCNREVLSVNRSKINFESPYSYEFIHDLSIPWDSKSFISVLEEIFSRSRFTEIRFVHNAGTLGKIDPTLKLGVQSLRETFEINFFSGISIYYDLLKFTNRLDLKLGSVFVSSGAASKAYEGWAEYCSSKAALDMWVRVAFEEQHDNSTFALFLPGVVDTSMQEIIRATSKKSFPKVGFFQHLLSEKKLASPYVVAKRLGEYLLLDKLERNLLYLKY